MPNTLIHVGIQTVLSKAIGRTISVKWVAVGCIIPDLPWILQRLTHAFVPGADFLLVRSYVIIQASFFFCMILCGAISQCHPQRLKLFLLLSGNCLLHLLLDSLQIKWGNGVHLFAPLSWHLSSFELLWPEHWSTHVLSFFGMILLLFFGFQERRLTPSCNIQLRDMLKALVLMLFYFAAPLFFIHQPFNANNHYLGTWADKENRKGKMIAIDRGTYESPTNTIRIFSGESLQLTDPLNTPAGKLSLKGRFTDNTTIQPSHIHVHTTTRDSYSLIGLFLTLLLWSLAIFTKVGKVDR